MLKGTGPNPSALLAANNLSDIPSASVALANLGGLKGGVLQALAQTSAFSLVLPAKGFILDIATKNTTANAVTGGLKFVTTSGAVDIVAALAVAGSFIGSVFDAALLKRFFSTSASQTIFVDAVAAWNSASVEVTIPYLILP